MDFITSGGKFPGGMWELPPLILHPFDTRTALTKIADAGLASEADQRYLEGRFAELRMLCFLGKDLDRWLGQCVEVAVSLGLKEFSEASFVSMLLFDPPPNVPRKMTEWGVGNYQIIFSRALGLNTVYPFPPGVDSISEPLLRHFHHYADTLFDLRLKTFAGAELCGAQCQLEIYASSEYSRLLERSWSEPLS